MEVFKELPGYDGQYMISNEGRVKSMYRWYINPMTRTRHKKDRELIMSQHLDVGGYPRIKLVDGMHKVHRLVAICFCDNPDNLPHVNHIDGNKANNHSDNLEWCTIQQNNQHAWDTGLQSRTKIAEIRAKDFIVISPDGERIEVHNLKKFCREHDLTSQLMHCVINGRQKQHKGWKIYERSAEY